MIEKMKKLTVDFINRIIDYILQLQPLFAAPLFFTILMDAPPLWLSLIIGIFPILMRYYRSRVVYYKTVFDIPILILSTGLIIGYFIAADKGVAEGALVSYLGSLLIYIGITSNYNRGKKYWYTLVTVIFLIGLGLSAWFFSQGTGRIFSFNQFIFDFFNKLPKTDGPNLHQHGIGVLWGVFIPVILGAYLYSRRKPLAFLLLLSAAILVLCGSGGGWLAALAGIYVVVIIWRHKSVYYLIPFTGILTGMAFAFYNQLQWLSRSFSLASLIGRFDLWVKTIPMLNNQHGFWGLGPGNWDSLFLNTYGFHQNHLHNEILQLYSDAGVLGLIALLLGFTGLITTAKIVLRAPNTLIKGIGIGLLGSIAAGAIFGIFDVALFSPFYRNGQYVYISIPLFWIMVAGYSVVCQKLKMNPPQPRGGNE